MPAGGGGEEVGGCAEGGGQDREGVRAARMPQAHCRQEGLHGPHLHGPQGREEAV